MRSQGEYVCNIGILIYRIVMLYQPVVEFKHLIFFIYLPYDVGNAFIVILVSQVVIGVRITIEEKIKIIFLLLADPLEFVSIIPVKRSEVKVYLISGGSTEFTGLQICDRIKRGDIFIGS